MEQATRLKELLANTTMTQKELADRTGITAAAISRYVNGTRTPRGETLVRIASVLGVTTDYLLGASQARQNPKETTPDDDYYIALNAIIRSGTKWDRKMAKNLVETLVYFI